MIGEVLWGDHPLGRDVAGTQDTVMSFTREHALAYMERHYGAANTVVAVAGAVDHEDVVFRVEALLGDWPAGQRSEAIPAQDGQVAPRYRVTYKKTEQVHLCLAVPGLRHDHPDRYAQSLLNAILGEGMSSRLFTEIRERRGLAYDVHAYINRYRDAGEEVVYAAVAPEKATDAVQAVLEQLARLRDEPVPEVELAKTKEFVKGRILLSTEDSRNMASWLGNADMFMGEILDVDEVLRRIDAVTPEDIQRVARASYQQAKLNMAIVGPVKKAHSLGSLLSL
jgi:predicted Zn-dependent peptidase